MTSRQRRTYKARTGRKPPLYVQAGLRHIPGSRSWEVVSTGERISYNKGRARVAAMVDPGWSLPSSLHNVA